MSVLFRGAVLFIVMAALCLPAHAGEAAKKEPKNAGDASQNEMKSLDEQVQDIKTETLSLGTQLRLLEEKLLYPSSTQVAVYVSLEDMTRFRLDSIEIRVDDKPVAQHLYTLRELEALQKGGMQRIYVGNISSGEHGLQVQAIGRAGNSSGVRKTEKFRFRKEEGPKLLEVRLVDSDAHMITLRD